MNSRVLGDMLSFHLTQSLKANNNANKVHVSQITNIFVASTFAWCLFLLSCCANSSRPEPCLVSSALHKRFFIFKNGGFPIFLSPFI